MPILVYGPPSTSGTRDALKELILTQGCETNAAMKALKDSDKDKHEQLCTEVRSRRRVRRPGRAGQPDRPEDRGQSRRDRRVRLFATSRRTPTRCRACTMNGVDPTYATISDFKYPGARPLYIYVKNAHLDAIPGLREFVAEWAKSWGKDGPLTPIGLRRRPGDVAARSAKAATEFTAARPRRPEVSRRTRDVAGLPAPPGPRARAGRMAGGARARVELPPRSARGARWRRCRPTTPGTSRCGSRCRCCCS